MTMTFSTDKRFDLIAVGRACIDLNATEYNRPMEETMTFSKYVGGSPANIAIGSSKLGLKTGFIGKVSDDQHGRFIQSYMEKVGVDTSQMVKDTEGHKSGLTFTEIKSPKECSILMYRTDVADLNLRPEDVSEGYIAQAKILLISGTALAKSPSREAVFQAVDYAKRQNVPIAFELDYRPIRGNQRRKRPSIINGQLNSLLLSLVPGMNTTFLRILKATLMSKQQKRFFHHELSWLSSSMV